MATNSNPDTTSTTVVLIPLDRLKPSPHNARRTPHPESAIEALAASIHHKGLLQNLIVQPELDEDGKETGHYFVTAGEGRRQAQLLRVKRRQIRKSEPIPCLVNTSERPFELSLDENVTRTPMNAADQFEAFRQLAEEHGLGAEEIGSRFGVSAQVVRQRMRLGAVSPVLMQGYRDGDVTLEQLMAFAISEDHARQEHVWDVIQQGWNQHPSHIRRLMMERHVQPGDPRAIFAGDAYVAAGGEMVRDLFTEEDGGYFADVELLDHLVRERLTELAPAVQAEGWKWVDVRVEFPYDHGLRRVYPRQVELPARERKRFAALRAEFEELDERYDAGEELTDEEEKRFAELEEELQLLIEQQHVYDPDVIARGGVFVSLDRDGTARIERGFIRPEDEAGNKDARVDSDEESAPVPFIDSSERGPATGTNTGGTSRSGRLSDALVRDLTAHRTQALRLVVGNQPDVALLAITHALAAQVFFDTAHYSCLEVRATCTPLGRDAAGIEGSPPARSVAERHEAWAAQMPDEADGLWAFIVGLDTDRRMSLLAHCVAATVYAVQQRGERRAGAREAADNLGEATQLNMAEHWEPTAAGYFNRVNKTAILEAVREGASDEEAKILAPMKKHAMAEAAERKLSGRAWVPELLRLASSSDDTDCESPAAAA